MNKSELITAIAEQADITHAAAGKALNSIIETITGALQEEEQIKIVGFGTFSVKERAARTGRHPSTGEPLTIKAARVPHFKAGSALKSALNGEEATA